jgi:hypothetical protein
MRRFWCEIKGAMKTEIYAGILAKKLVNFVSNSSVWQWMFPSRRLVPVPIARWTSEVRRRHSRI